MENWLGRRQKGVVDIARKATKGVVDICQHSTVPNDVVSSTLNISLFKQVFFGYGHAVT